MSTESERLALYNRLGEVLGQDHADTLVNDLVTKEYLSQELEKHRLQLIADMHSMAAKQTRTMVGAMVALTGIYAGINLMIFG